MEHGFSKGWVLVLVLCAVLVAAPTMAAPAADDQGPAGWWSAAADLLARVWAAVEGGPHMDPNGIVAPGGGDAADADPLDGGPHMDPNG